MTASINIKVEIIEQLKNDLSRFEKCAKCFVLKICSSNLFGQQEEKP